MKRRKIACISIAIIITTLLTGCSLGDIPVVGKFLSKDTGEQTDVPVDDTVVGTEATVGDTPHIDAEYPPVPVGTVITIDDIFNVLSSAGLSTETVAGYLILDENGVEADQLTITQDTYFTFIYQMRDAEANEQSQMVIGVKVTDETVTTPENMGDELVQGEESQQQDTQMESGEVDIAQEPSAAKYEVFNFDECNMSQFDYAGDLELGKLYKASVLDFDLSKVLHYDGYSFMTKSLSDLTINYTDINQDLSGKLNVFCIPTSYIYMQAPDYEEGADMSVYDGDYSLIIQPVYADYTDEIYRTEDVLIMPLIEDVTSFAAEPSDDTKSECDFLMDESYDDDSGEIEDFYGAAEILAQLSETEDLFIFDDLLKFTVTDYSDMGTPDDMTDDVTWEEYEAGVISSAQSGETEEGTEEGTSTTVSTGTTTITETTTTTTESVLQSINEEVANSFRSRHPELFTFFPETDQVYSKWDWRIDDNTTVKGTVTLKDGTIIPQLERTEGGTIYDITNGTSSTSSFGDGNSSTGTTGSVFSSSGNGTTSSYTTTTQTGDDGSLTVGDEGYETTEAEEDEDEEDVTEYEISLGDTKCKVESNNTYRYMIDSQNSSTSEVFVNHRDNRYTIKVVDENTYMNYWTKDYLARSMNGYSITASDYNGSTVADNNAIVLMNIQYESSDGQVTVPYMAYIRNGSEYIIIIPDEEEEANSDVLADILKRCVSMV